MGKKLYEKHEMRRWQFLFAISTQMVLVSIEALQIGQFANYMLIAIAAEMMLFLIIFVFPKRK
tara:strand:- start:380 stop:568 length:189 start_codon:yes stop_codon:yes gene_type:complete